MSKPADVGTYVWVWFALIVLLAITSASAYLHIGAWNMVVNMAVAVSKVALIGIFFMHLRRADSTVRVASVTALLFLFLLAFLSFADLLTRPRVPAEWREPQSAAFGGTYE